MVQDQTTAVAESNSNAFAKLRSLLWPLPQPRRPATSTRALHSLRAQPYTVWPLARYVRRSGKYWPPVPHQPSLE